MMKVNLSYVPQGGGETDFNTYKVEMPQLPSAGDVIRLYDETDDGPTIASFIVLRSWWNVHTTNGNPTKPAEPWVECQFALDPATEDTNVSKFHETAVRRYAATKGEDPLEIPVSMY